MTHVASAPTRIDLAGGTLDIWPLYLMHESSVTVNVAVDVCARASARPRPAGFSITSADRGLAVEAETAADLVRREPRLALPARLVAALSPDRPVALHLAAAAPAHAGLGGSSALAVATAAALDRHAGGTKSREALLRWAMDVETAVIAVPTGQQDYVAALWGGLQTLHWRTGGLQRERLPARDLGQRLVLAYTGAPRFSGANNWEVTKRRIDGDKDVTLRLDAVRDAARALHTALVRGDWAEAARAMDAEWIERKGLTPGITTPEIEAHETRARAAGAAAFKVCGAGGGGCVVALVEPDRRDAVRRALAADGSTCLEFSVDEGGLVVESSEDGPREGLPTMSPP